MDVDRNTLVLEGQPLQGDALCKFITTITSHPQLFSYSQFVSSTSLNELESTHPQFFNLFQLFRFKTYQDFKNNPQSYPVLSAAQENKLRQLTVLTECQKNTQMSMKGLFQKLGLDLLRCIKLLIEMTDRGALKVKISQKDDRIKVFYAVSRDVSISSKQVLQRKLDQIIMNNKKTIASLQQQIKVVTPKRLF